MSIWLQLYPSFDCDGKFYEHSFFSFSCFLNCDQVSGPLDHRPDENIVGKAFFRWQRCRIRILVFDINVEIWKQLQWTSSWYVSCGTVMLMILIHSLTFTCRAPIRKQHPINDLFDFTISFCSFNFQKRNFLHRILQMRSCAFNPKHGVGAFGVFPVLQRKRCNFIRKIFIPTYDLYLGLVAVCKYWSSWLL